MPVRARNVFRVVVALSLILAFSAAPMAAGWMAGDNIPKLGELEPELVLYTVEDVQQAHFISNLTIGNTVNLSSKTSSSSVTYYVDVQIVYDGLALAWMINHYLQPFDLCSAASNALNIGFRYWPDMVFYSPQ